MFLLQIIFVKSILVNVTHIRMFSIDNRLLRKLARFFLELASVG